MDIQKLKNLETNTDIISKYAGLSSFGKNRIVYLPLLIGIGLLLFVILALANNLTETIGTAALIIVGVVAIICFVLAKIIATNTKKKVISETTFAPICVAKKIIGNTAKTNYYCIYTTGENRHNEEFINKISEKINNAIQKPENNIEKEIFNLFRPDFIKPNEFAKKLPLEFTENILVWRKQVSFLGMNTQILEKINNEDDQFGMIAIVPENAKFLFNYYH